MSSPLVTTALAASPLPPTRTEIILPGVVEPDGLLVRVAPLPAPTRGQVLVQVEATGVSFAEQSMRRGRYPGQPKFPFIPGYDLVGQVVAIGPGVEESLLGQRVASLTKTGAWATYVTLPATELLPVPTGLDPAEVEALIVNGLTAWQMLHRTAHVQPGQTVLVHGANGGVGTILVQLAQLAGARVIGTASPRHHAALRAQGVEPLAYDDPDLVQRVRQLAPVGVAVVFDNIGGPGLARSFRLLQRGGTLVSYAQASTLRGKQSVELQFMGLLAKLFWWTVLPNGRRAVFYHIWSGKSRPAFWPRLREDLGQVLGLLAQGRLTPCIAARFPLTHVQAALKLAESHTAYGKVVLLPGEPQS